ncbi:ATP-binding protein [Streptomyces sp. PR69]|uniref:ATP-binding protein n=1 Tax=Streptomyces sp. PR69 TaxID=2984950 RepID=UPI002264D79A|nr:AAA family ATPase [Streptomyces sp. PR69]
MRRSRSDLPAELNRFIGRADELAELGRLLSHSRLVTVVGAGGVGKSRLAERAAAALQNRYGDGVWIADLSMLRDPTLLAHTLIEALGVTDHTSRPPHEILARRLARRELLLVVDGVEQLAQECAEVLRELLRGSPGLTVLATGRRPLRLAGEQVFPLTPLPEADAAALFTDRAARVLPGFGPGGDDCDLVRELCRRLDGIPLALELAAARLPVLSLTQLVQRLDDRFRLLTCGAGGALPRHQTLRAAVGWSHELCSPQERLLWARLSVFAGEFDLEAVEYICTGPDLPVESVLDVLGELIAQSVVCREETPAGVRYRMLDTVRVYGAAWLAALGDAERLRRRHRDWYVGLATWCELDWFSPRQGEVAACVQSALPNLRAALELCLDTDDEAHLGQHLAGTLWFCWVGCGRLAEGRHWLDRALAAAPDALGPGRPVHEEARLKALWVLGYVAILQGDSAAAAGALYECRERAARADHPVAAAYAEHRMGCLALVSDDMPRAERLLRSALGAYRRAGELNSNVLMAQVELAMALVFQNRLADAAALCEDVRGICEDRGEVWTRAYALYVLAYAAWTDGDLERARTLLSQCIAINHRFNDLVGLVLAIELLALVTASEGDPAEAAVLQGAAAPMWEAVGLPLFGSGHFGAPRELCARRAGEALGAERYAACEREGRALTPEAAVRRALASPPARRRAVEAPGGAEGIACGRTTTGTGTGVGAGTDAGTGTGADTGAGASSGTSSGTREPAGSPTGQGGEAAG